MRIVQGSYFPVGQKFGDNEDRLRGIIFTVEKLVVEGAEIWMISS